MSIQAARSRARALADVGAGVVLASVEIAAPAERVFRAITDPRELKEWWGSPETYRADTWEADLRVGGAWRVDGRSAQGKPYAVYGEYLVIEPPRRLVLTWQHDWDADHPKTQITYTLADVPGGTQLTVRHEGFVNQAESCTRHSNGWERVLGWLVDHLENVAQPGL